MQGENTVKQVYATSVRAYVGTHQHDRRPAPLLTRNRARRAAGKGKLRPAVRTRSLRGLAGAGSLAVCAAVLVGCAAPPRPRAEPSASVQRHILEVAEALPGDSPLRRDLEAGLHGSGTRRRWMDAMLRQGVRRVGFRAEFFAIGRPVYVKVTRLVYFSEYDRSSCSQIADARRLSEIRASGLQGQLIEAAKERTAAAPWWQTMDPHLPRLRGRSQFSLFADEWLPEVALLSGLPDRRADSFVDSVLIGDLADVTVRLRRGGGLGVREEAMWSALVDNDPCMTTALLKSGVDPNLGSELLWFSTGLTQAAQTCNPGSICESRQAESQKTKSRPVSWPYTDCWEIFRQLGRNLLSQHSPPGPLGPKSYRSLGVKGARSGASAALKV